MTFEEISATRVRALDFADPTFGVRNTRLRCLTFPLDELDWRVFVFLAPVGFGLWFLRVYGTFDDSLRRIFFAHQNGVPDNDRAHALEHCFRRLGIKKKSEHAYRCFGIYPRLWGDRFSPPRLNGLVPCRLLSVAVPAQSAEAVRAHYERQSVLFDPRCTAKVDESESLLIDGSVDSTEDGLLLLRSASSMDAYARAAVRARLMMLIESDREKRKFEDQIHPGLKFSGAFHSWDRRDLLPGRETECAEIAQLRVRLMCRLEWPHALDWMRRRMEASAGDATAANLIAEIDGVLDRFPDVRANPLSQPCLSH